MTYNQQQYIRQCLDSLLSQIADFDFEIVVADDCSKDGTLDILMEYQAKNPKTISIIRNLDNIGLVNNWIRVISLLRGKYVACCAGDDYWIDDHKLHKQVNILEADKDVSMVFTNNQQVDENNNVLKYKDVIVPNNKEGKYDLHAFFTMPYKLRSLTMMYRKAAADSIMGMYVELKNDFLEDWTFHICLLTKGYFVYIDEVTAAYRVNAGFITHSSKWTNKERWYTDIFLRHKLIDLLPDEYRKYLSDDSFAYFKIGLCHYKSKQYMYALKYILKAAANNPAMFLRLIASRFRWP